jgi:hypothetical protein
VRLVAPSLNPESTDAAIAPRVIETHTLTRTITEEGSIEGHEVLPGTDLTVAVNPQRRRATDNQPLWKRWKMPALLLAVLLTAAISAALFFKPSPESEIRTVAVLPFRSLDASDDDP